MRAKADTTPGSPRQNQLLAVLPAEVQGRLFPYLGYVLLQAREVLHDSGQALQHVYFPAGASVSLVCDTRQGASLEVATVGSEGLVGVELFMGGQSTTSRAIVQGAGDAFRLPVHRLMNEFNRHGEFFVQTLRYSQSLITQMAQTAVCNRHHSVLQQVCRKLLLSLDRSTCNRLDMTQEIIASLLGVRREGITEVARKLLALGVIEYRRGHIEVLDRPGLERLSCECYAVVRNEAFRLQPYLVRHLPIDEIKSAPMNGPTGDSLRLCRELTTSA